MSRDKLENLLAQIKLEAQVLYPVRSKEAAKASLDSKFGGSPYAEEHDAWPQCSTCKSELLFVVQLNDEKIDSLFVFYYCFECFPSGGRSEEKGQWIIRRYRNTSMEKYKEIPPPQENEYSVVPCRISAKTVKVLPDWDGLASHSKEASDLCCEMSDGPWEEYEAVVLKSACLSDFSTLLGGYPRWVQGEAITKCSKCSEELKFLGQIDSEEAAGVMWGDAGLVYLFQCENHPDMFDIELQCY